jgi:hypothetical protein
MEKYLVRLGKRPVVMTYNSDKKIMKLGGFKQNEREMIVIMQEFFGIEDYMTYYGKLGRRIRFVVGSMTQKRFTRVWNLMKDGGVEMQETSTVGRVFR